MFSVPLWLVVAYGVAVALFALWRGRWPERAIAAAVLVEFVAEPDLIVHLRLPIWFAPAWDVVILATCVACALRGSRYWTVVASSFALLAVTTDVLRLAPGVTLWAYLSAERIWTVLLVAVLLVGAGSVGRSTVAGA